MRGTRRRPAHDARPFMHFVDQFMNKRSEFTYVVAKYVGQRNGRLVAYAPARPQ